MKLAIARWTMSGFLPAFQAMTASTANSGIVWISARIASASPCEIRNSAASAPQATTKAAPIIAGKVQSADQAEPGAPCSTAAASNLSSRSHFMARGYSMGRRARDRVPVEPSDPRHRSPSRGTHPPPARRREGDSRRGRRRNRARASSPRRERSARTPGRADLRASAAGVARRARAPRRRAHAAAPAGGGAAPRRSGRGDPRAGGPDRLRLRRPGPRQPRSHRPGGRGRGGRRRDRRAGDGRLLPPARRARERRQRPAPPGLGPRLVRTLRRGRESRGPAHLRSRGSRRRERVRGAARPALGARGGSRGNWACRRAPIATSTAGSRSRCGRPSTL